MNISDARMIAAQAKLLEARGAALEQAGERLPALGQTDPSAPRTAFGDLIGSSINRVNEAMNHAQAEAAAFIREEPGADLVRTMVASNKAQVSFKAMVEVRNQLVQAYKDIASMPI